MLRQAGIKPLEIRIENKSEDTLENILYSLRKINGTEIGVVSSPSHLDRVEYIVRRGKEDGSIDKNIHIYRIETKESFADKIYSVPASLLTRYKLRKGLKDVKLSEGFVKKMRTAFIYLVKMFREKEEKEN